MRPRAAQTALRALARASDRARSQGGLRPEVLEALDVVCGAARSRLVQGDEETLTLVSEADQGAGRPANEAQRDQRSQWGASDATYAAASASGGRRPRGGDRRRGQGKGRGNR